jgi:S1-C subfamily serine protease
VNVLDVMLIALLALAGISGFRRGALLQVLAYGGLVLGLILGALIGPPVARAWESPGAQAGTVVAILLGCAGIGNALGWLAGTWVRAHARRTRFGTADAAGGSVVSVVAVLLVTWFLALNLVNGPFPTVAAEIRGSVVVRAIGTALPRPPSLLGEFRRFFNRFGFPDVFTGLPPAPAGPVSWPTQEDAQRAFDTASASTVRIVGQACDEIQSGTGFVVSGNYVVTNAHVVAGVDVPQVQEQNGGSQQANIVLYDPRLDLAVLYVERSPGPALELATHDVVRGTGGAVLGYPGGGNLVGGRAAVRRAIDAVGRDIYGRHEVDREVYELQATVQTGDSGGPFVLPTGVVAGVVFAASSTDRGIGYAISSIEALPDIRSAVGRTAAVGTGACVR